MRLSTPVAAAVAAALGVFAVRRLVFVATAVAEALASPENPVSTPVASSVCLVVPARNEGSGLDAMLSTVAALDPAPVAVVLVDDGSSDATPEVMERWASRRETWSWLRMEPGADKAVALNAGVAAAPAADLVATCDADVRMERECLRLLSEGFVDGSVGAVSGLFWPANADESVVARYCALELWQHQLVTSVAKDRLGLGPPTHGFACFRRAALEQVAGFIPGSLGEDVGLSAALHARGWRTRFAPDARVHGRVPVTLSDYTRQHVRWARGLHAAAPRMWRGRRWSPVRLEGWLHAAGYVDRPLLLAAAGFAATGVLPWGIPVGYLALAGVEAVCALHLAGMLGRLPRFAAAAVVMFGADLATALSAHRSTAPSWHSPRP